MKKFQKPILAVTAFLLCANLSMDQKEGSVTGGAANPAVNIMGTILDNTGKSVNASYILISGLYKQIPVYAKPKDSEEDPRGNATDLDLAEIQKFEVPNRSETHTFDNYKYILINVYTKGESHPTPYFVNSNKQITYKKINSLGIQTDKNIDFSKIENIVITGYKKREDQQSGQPHINHSTTPAHVAQHAITRPSVHPSTSAPTPKPKPKPMLQKKTLAPTTTPATHPAALQNITQPTTTTPHHAPIKQYKPMLQQKTFTPKTMPAQAPAHVPQHAPVKQQRPMLQKKTSTPRPMAKPATTQHKTAHKAVMQKHQQYKTKSKKQYHMLAGHPIEVDSTENH
ncbi:MAG: hypothetical protein ACJAZS_000638 [Alteromonas naphthalenivorans]|jgi:hypothetical protein